jgi:hypothetical protein
MDLRSIGDGRYAVRLRGRFGISERPDTDCVGVFRAEQSHSGRERSVSDTLRMRSRRDGVDNRARNAERHECHGARV